MIGMCRTLTPTTLTNANPEQAQQRVEMGKHSSDESQYAVPPTPARSHAR
jgi:hypothetical protein